MTDEYITKKEFEKFTEYNTLTFILWAGLIFIIPVLYSITANTKNYVGFYGLCVVGIFAMFYSVIKYFKWRKKYV